MYNFLREKLNIFRCQPKDGYQQDISKIGEVVWPMSGESGYKSGLEEIENLSGFKNAESAYWFCREVAIGVVNPQAGQVNVVEQAQRMIEKQLLTPKQVEYIYNKFTFDSTKYVPPDFDLQAERMREALKKRI